jgi:hypothetical protein
MRAAVAGYDRVHVIIIVVISEDVKRVVDEPMAIAR